MPSFEMIAFDADDTLWHNERLYIAAQARLAKLLTPYNAAEDVAAQLYQIEMDNLPFYGYGIKGFGLSMIEACLRLSDGRLSSDILHPVLNQVKEMLTAEVMLVDGVAGVLDALADSYPLALITKGDLFEQEAKVLRSGLAAYFQPVEIVSEKTPESYARILARHGVSPERFLMVGNSLRSDILPVLALGGHAVYIPHEDTWSHESAAVPHLTQPGFYELADIAGLPDLLAQITVD